MERRIKNNPEVKRRLSSLELDAAFHDIALAVRGANSEMMRDLSAAFSLLRRPQDRGCWESENRRRDRG